MRDNRYASPLLLLLLSSPHAQGVFTKELDVSLLTGQTDIAVHSLKDLTTVLPDGLVLAAGLCNLCVTCECHVCVCDL